MPHVDQDTTQQQPLRVSILRHDGHLVASVHTALDDSQLLRFRTELLDQIGTHRARGVIIDVAALDVIDSFACHTLRALAQVARLRGAHTVIVGIQPDVAIAMTRLGTILARRAHRTRPRGGRRPPRQHRRGAGCRRRASARLTPRSMSQDITKLADDQQPAPRVNHRGAVVHR